MGPQPINRWYKDVKPEEGNERKADPVFYDSLMKRVYPTIVKKKIDTIAFIWMQVQRGVREKLGDVYERSLIGILQQLYNDLKRNDVNFLSVARMILICPMKISTPDHDQVYCGERSRIQSLF